MPQPSLAPPDKEAMCHSPETNAPGTMLRHKRGGRRSKVICVSCCAFSMETQLQQNFKGHSWLLVFSPSTPFSSLHLYGEPCLHKTCAKPPGEGWEPPQEWAMGEVFQGSMDQLGLLGAAGSKVGCSISIMMFSAGSPSSVRFQRGGGQEREIWVISCQHTAWRGGKTGEKH